MIATVARTFESGTVARDDHNGLVRDLRAATQIELEQGQRQLLGEGFETHVRDHLAVSQFENAHAGTAVRNHFDGSILRHNQSSIKLKANCIKGRTVTPGIKDKSKCVNK